MVVGPLGADAALRRAHEQALLHEVGLVHVLERIGVFRQRRRERGQTHGPPAELHGQELEDAIVHRVQTERVHLEEAERLNAVLPLIKWEVDNNDLSEAMSDELYLYYEDLLKGRLDGILDEEEAPIIIKDLTESYIKAFGKDTLDEEDQ